MERKDMNMNRNKKEKLILRGAIFLLEQFRRAICSSSQAFEKSLEGRKSYDQGPYPHYFVKQVVLELQ